MIKLLLSFFLFCNCSFLFAQQPVMLVNDKDSAKIVLKTLKIEVKVVGNIATTTMEMQFCNNSNRVLEGELTFPMPEGVSISRYALDMNGTMREAVPVEKEKGQVVFENIIRKKVDPGLLEKVEGNNFRTRIYPLPANGCRTIIIAYDQPLYANQQNELSYNLPLQFRKPIADFSIDFNVYSNLEPEIGKSCNTALKFTNEKNVFHANVTEKDFKPNGSFQISIPKLSGEAQAVMQKVDGQYYFLVNHFPEYKMVEKKLPGKLHLIWDNSFSGLNRDHKKEFSFIKAYCQKIQNGTITLSTIGYTFKTINTFVIRSGNCEELFAVLNNMVYDGATNLSLINWNVNADEHLLFTDGLNTYGNFSGMQFPRETLHTVTAAPTANFGVLNFMANRTGGQFINLNTQSIANAIKALSNQVFRLINVKTTAAVSEIYPSFAIVKGNVAVSGIATNANATITLQYGFGNTVTVEEKVELNFASHAIEKVPLNKIWAQQKITQLEEQYDVFKNQISELGKKYNLVTRNTSLIVLDDIADYIKYEIMPPADLKSAYDSIMNEKAEIAKQQFNNSLENAKDLIGQLKDWWEEDFSPKITGYIVDSWDGHYLPNVKIVSGNKTFTTNSSGRFEIINFTGLNYTLSAVDYKPKTFTMDPYYGADYIISLESTKPKPVVKKTASAKSITLIKSNEDKSKVSGVIVDASTGNLLASTSIITKHSNQATITDGKGYFSLPVTDKSIQAQISYVGFELQNVQLTAGGEYRIELQPRNQKLEEVVVSGYGTYYNADSAKSTGAVQKAAADFEYSKIQEEQSNKRSASPPPPPAPPSFQNFGTKDERGMSAVPAAESYNMSLQASANTTLNFSTTKLTTTNIDESNNASISIREIASNKPFIKIIRETSAAQRYAKYLELRKNYLYTPGFYFEVAKFFFSVKEKELGLQILSTVADLNLEDHELYKMLGYQLKIQGETMEAVQVFKKVLDWRPQEPQSYRDYGLALADAGKYQNALDSLYTAITKNYDGEKSGDFSGIEEIIVTEINNLIALHPTVNASKIDKDLLVNMPVDVRVVLNWNMNDTDMDLWVEDPRMEKCYYGNQHTKIGGRISDDFTSGYGPEQFMLKKALKGKYKVKLHFFGESVQKIAGGTTVMAEIYTNYGKPNQERKLIAMQMEKEEEREGILVGEFTF